MAEIDDFTDSMPRVGWLERGSNQVGFKAGNERYHAQFYYKGSQQFGTGKKNVPTLQNVSLPCNRSRQIMKSWPMMIIRPLETNSDT